MVKVKRLRADPYSLGPYLLRGRNCLTLRLGLWLIRNLLFTMTITQFTGKKLRDAPNCRVNSSNDTNLSNAKPSLD